MLKRRTAYSTHFIMSPFWICSPPAPFIFLLPHGTSERVIYGKYTYSLCCIWQEFLLSLLIMSWGPVLRHHSLCSIWRNDAESIPLCSDKRHEKLALPQLLLTFFEFVAGILFITNLALAGLAKVLSLAFGKGASSAINLFPDLLTRFASLSIIAMGLLNDLLRQIFLEFLGRVCFITFIKHGNCLKKSDSSIALEDNGSDAQS